MLDRSLKPFLDIPLDFIARGAVYCGVRPNQVTFFAFLLGIVAFVLICLEHYGWALVFVLLNRVLDGLDGVLARRMKRISDRGGFLDIVFDFLFYGLVPLGFAVADPELNALAAALLLFSFIGTGSSFLAFALFAQKRNISTDFSAEFSKSFHYLGGLTEGTETVFMFVLMLLFPSFFWLFAIVFSIACFFTTSTRIYSSYVRLRDEPPPDSGGDADKPAS